MTVSTSVDTGLLRANFRLSHLIDLPHAPAPEHAEIDLVCINPIFAHRARQLLSGCHRILRKAVLYYALPPGQAVPDTLDVMVQVRAWVGGCARVRVPVCVRACSVLAHSRP